MGFLKEFKEFAVKGNVMDMAVGVIIGGAFGKIVTSLVNDVIMPPIGMIVGGVDFSDMRSSRQSIISPFDTPLLMASVTISLGSIFESCSIL